MRSEGVTLQRRSYISSMGWARGVKRRREKGRTELEDVKKVR